RGRPINYARATQEQRTRWMGAIASCEAVEYLRHAIHELVDRSATRMGGIAIDAAVLRDAIDVARAVQRYGACHRTVQTRSPGTEGMQCRCGTILCDLEKYTTTIE